MSHQVSSHNEESRARAGAATARRVGGREPEPLPVPGVLARCICCAEDRPRIGMHIVGDRLRPHYICNDCWDQEY